MMNHMQGELNHGLEPGGTEWGQGGGANQIAFAKKIPNSVPCFKKSCQSLMEDMVMMNHMQEEQNHRLEPSGTEWDQRGGAIQIAVTKKIAKSYLLCEGLCQNIEQVHRPTAQGQLLKDKLRDHRKKKKHHLRRGGTIADPHRTEESCQVHVLEDESVIQRGQKTNKGHTTQLTELQQPTMVRVTGDVQKRELKTTKFDTAQSCNDEKRGTAPPNTGSLRGLTGRQRV